MSLAVGSVVRYYQPTTDEILAAWAGDRRGPERGELVETRIVSVSLDGHYYTAEDGTLLRSDDVREVVR